MGKKVFPGTFFGASGGNFRKFHRCQDDRSKSFAHEAHTSILPSGKLTKLWNITIFKGKINYKLPLSIAMKGIQWLGGAKELFAHHSPYEMVSGAA